MREVDAGIRWGVGEHGVAEVRVDDAGDHHLAEPEPREGPDQTPGVLRLHHVRRGAREALEGAEQPELIDVDVRGVRARGGEQFEHPPPGGGLARPGRAADPQRWRGHGFNVSGVASGFP
ncbi:hypothetical protein ACLQ3K_02465 [Tsukamurella sp. DT100]|uniref:hypothetical protein n=1 Tax=Tsukamurella sp. DT100 TaxID=3393415 RepID=UPI003CEB9E2B